MENYLQNDKGVTIIEKSKVLWRGKAVSAGVGKLFARRATFLKDVAVEGRALSLQSKNIYSMRK